MDGPCGLRPLIIYLNRHGIRFCTLTLGRRCGALAASAHAWTNACIRYAGLKNSWIYHDQKTGLCLALGSVEVAWRLPPAPRGALVASA